MDMNEITVLNRINHCKYGFWHLSLEDVLLMIKSGDLIITDSSVGSYTLRLITEAIRQEKDCNTQNIWKEAYCPVVSFNGVWDESGIVEYSHYTALDFDKIYSEQEMIQKMTMLKSIPYVVAIFRTFKPYRFKAIVLHNNTDPNLHSVMYEEIIQQCGADGLDTNCKDLKRRNYLVWDKDVWINPNPIPYDYKPAIHVCRTPIMEHHESSGKQKSPQSIINILNSSWHKRHPEYWKTGNRATSIFRCACTLCEYGVPQDYAEDYFLNGGWIDDDFNENEVIKQVNGGYKYKSNEFGSKFFT